MKQYDYVELWDANMSSTTNPICVQDMQLVAREL